MLAVLSVDLDLELELLLVSQLVVPDSHTVLRCPLVSTAFASELDLHSHWLLDFLAPCWVSSKSLDGEAFVSGQFISEVVPDLADKVCGDVDHV